MRQGNRIKDWIDGLAGLAMFGTLIWFAPGWCARMAEDKPKFVYSINSDASIGCLDLEEMDRLAMLSSDRMAYYVHHRRLREAGRCVFLQKGDELVVEQYSGFRELYLARRKGDPTSYWIPKHFVAKEKEPPNKGG